MTDEKKPSVPKNKRGRPKKVATKARPVGEFHLDEESKAEYKKTSSDKKYVRIMIHHSEGESRVCGPFWGHAPTVKNPDGSLKLDGNGKPVTASAPQLYIYRGCKVVVPEWVLGCLEMTKVETFEHDISTVPPRPYKVIKTRFPYDVIEEGLTEKDYEDFKKSLENKPHDPFKQQYVQG